MNRILLGGRYSSGIWIFWRLAVGADSSSAGQFGSFERGKEKGVEGIGDIPGPALSFSAALRRNGLFRLVLPGELALSFL